MKEEQTDQQFITATDQWHTLRLHWKQ